MPMIFIFLGLVLSSMPNLNSLSITLIFQKQCLMHYSKGVVKIIFKKKVLELFQRKLHFNYSKALFLQERFSLFEHKRS